MAGALRIPRIKFPRRHPKSSSTGSASQAAAKQTSENSSQLSTAKSDVPRAPGNIASGGKASLQPKRTPVTNQEIEAVLLGGGCS